MLIGVLEELADAGELQHHPTRFPSSPPSPGAEMAVATRGTTPHAVSCGRPYLAGGGAAVRGLCVGAPVRGQRARLQPARALAGARDRHRRAPVRARVPPGPWRWFAIGFLLFWLGDLYTYSYPRLTGAEVPFPSLGDAAYVIVYPALMMGLLILVRRRNPEKDRAGAIHSLIITLGLALVSWIALIQPSLHDDELSTRGQAGLDRLPDRGHPAARGGHPAHGRPRAPAGRRSTCSSPSIMALLATDFAYGVVTLAGAYDGQVWLDVGWISFYLLWGAAAALHPSMPGPRAGGAGPRHRGSRRCGSRRSCAPR